jgi:flagellar hook-length control protein FliK
MTSGGDHSVVMTAGDAGATPGQTGAASTSAGTASPGQSVDVAAAATSTHLDQIVAQMIPASLADAPKSPDLAVVSALSSVPAPTASTVSAAPVTGQAVPLAPPAVHQQVLTAVSPLLRGPDGGYSLQLQLHPHDLGAVQVNVEVRHGEISIQLHAAHEGARDALRGGLSELRQQLESQGLRAGSMEVGSGSANAQQRETPWSRSQRVDLPGRGLNPSDQLVATAAAASSSVLDLRM